MENEERSEPEFQYQTKLKVVRRYDKWTTLEERMRTVEGNDLSNPIRAAKVCLVPNIVIPRKFRVPKFVKYTRIECPKTHLRSYYNKMAELSFNISQDLEIRSIGAGTNVVESLIHVELSILVGVPMRQPLLATFRLATSDSVPPLIEEKIDWASKMCQLDMDHQQELQGRIYEAKKDINFNSKQGHCFWENVDDCDYLNGPLEQEDDPIRSESLMTIVRCSLNDAMVDWISAGGDGPSTLTVEEGQYTHDVSPRGYGIRGASINGNIRDLHGDFSMIPRCKHCG
ncbi:hypothetical protein DKX38_001198 [Salix brachista]|uniref:Uncharacterized protein n=1 Tax=Salix brachista TaxID=2182728 RepID=A0A5N5P2K1_9ROSI|nr:hypothetical protein DKX38_001198 [Salix brachista]